MATAKTTELTLAEAAALAGRSELTLRRAIDKGRLPSVRKFGRVLVLDVDVMAAFPGRPALTTSAPVC